MKTNEITLTLTQEELVLLHSALCCYRGKVGTLLSSMNEFGLDDSEAMSLWNRIGSLSSRLATEQNGF